MKNPEASGYARRLMGLREWRGRREERRQERQLDRDLSRRLSRATREAALLAVETQTELAKNLRTDYRQKVAEVEERDAELQRLRAPLKAHRESMGPPAD